MTRINRYLIWLIAALCLVFLTPQTIFAQTAKNSFQDSFNSSDRLNQALSARAEALGVSAVSLTVLNQKGDIVSAYAGEDISEHSLFQAASMSKSVTAVGVLILAYERQIDLDDDIRPYIKSLDWTRIRGGGTPVSLRQLLLHTAGATVSGFPGYKRSKPLPSSVEIVMGGKGVNTGAVKLTKTKDSFRYSGGGYQILQVFVEDVTGQSFDDALADLVLEPLEMTKSTFVQPPEVAEIGPLSIASAESGFNPIHGVFRPMKDTWKNYPEQAAAGLWTTSDDFMKFALMLRDVSEGKDVLGIPNSVLRSMFEEVDKRYGLGVMLSIDKDGSLVFFQHTGGNAGYRCIFRVYPKEGIAIVAMGNSPQSIKLIKEAIAQLVF